MARPALAVPKEPAGPAALAVGDPSDFDDLGAGTSDVCTWMLSDPSTQTVLASMVFWVGLLLQGCSGRYACKIRALRLPYLFLDWDGFLCAGHRYGGHRNRKRVA